MVIAGRQRFCTEPGLQALWHNLRGWKGSWFRPPTDPQLFAGQFSTSDQRHKGLGADGGSVPVFHGDIAGKCLDALNPLADFAVGLQVKAAIRRHMGIAV